jgi:hypothetical protein
MPDSGWEGPDDDEATLAARRRLIAEAAVRLIDRDGLRALTQRAVDQELGLPMGTTSFYARTERQLVRLVVGLLAERTGTDVEGAPARVTTVDEAVPLLVAMADAVAGRRADTRARFALSIDLTNDPDLHSFITYGSPVRARLVALAERLLTDLGAPNPASHAADLVALVNGLVFDRLAGPGVHEAHRARADVVLRAYLTGLSASG